MKKYITVSIVSAVGFAAAALVIYQNKRDEGPIYEVCENGQVIKLTLDELLERSKESAAVLDVVIPVPCEECAEPSLEEIKELEDAIAKLKENSRLTCDVLEPN